MEDRRFRYEYPISGVGIVELEETGLYWNHTASKATIDVGSRKRVAHTWEKEIALIPKRSLGVNAPTFFCDQ